jgi:hypothetical protein
VTREASNLFYARLRLSNNQLAAKTEFIYMIREMRHCGVALGLDTLKYTSIDFDVRSTKSVGLKVEYGEQIDYGESRGIYRTVGDQEHIDIIDGYFEGLSMGRSLRSLDVQLQPFTLRSTAAARA